MTEQEKAELNATFDRSDIELAKRFKRNSNDGAGSALQDFGNDGSVPTVDLKEFFPEE